VRTRVGYTGGTTPDPTYHRLGDHTEAFQVDYDPSRISYEDLLAIFWSSHDPRSAPFSTQYKPAVFVHDDEQAEAARLSRDGLRETIGAEVRTEILPAKTFYLAEDYHQKYRLQADRVIGGELRQCYPNTRPFVDSTAAARINGFIAGHGTPKDLDEMIDDLGLSETARGRLRKVVGRRGALGFLSR
jgi:peptide-methionine (S)-S-oxide reductase